jgi:hypothetical protein
VVNHERKLLFYRANICDTLAQHQTSVPSPQPLLLRQIFHLIRRPFRFIVYCVCPPPAAAPTFTGASVGLGVAMSSATALKEVAIVRCNWRGLG